MPWIDYVIGDRFTLTDELESYFSERMIRLNGCFLPGDRKRQVGKMTTRTDCGLPENTFVFATFNNAYKLNPVMWDCWMRILRQVPNSVLWVVDDNPWATENLRAAALTHGIAPERLIPQLQVLSVAKMLGEAIWRIHEESSVSSRFR